MKFHGLLFDLDGTLLNTLEDLADSMNTVLRRRGFPIHEIKKYRYLVGNGMDVLVRRAVPSDVKDELVLTQCLDEMKEFYASHWNVKTKPYDGITEMLCQLRTAGLSISVLSNKLHEFTVKMVQYYFDPEYFTHVIGAGRFAKKPDPEAALYIVKNLGYAASDFLYVGDSGVDMKTACAAGIPAAGALWGFRDRKELEINGANYLLDRPSDIITIINR